MSNSLENLDLFTLNDKSYSAIIALGANLGNAIKTLQDAALDILNIEHIELINASSLYKTKPVGFKEQDDFINAVLQINTSLSPLKLYQELQQIEQKYGRKRLFKNGPRTLDLDIITYADYISKDTRVLLPHPRAQERAFVLVPLCEIAPFTIFSDSKLSAQEALKNIPLASAEVERLDLPLIMRK